MDIIEQGLDEVTQEMLIKLLRRREPDARTLFVMTRSSAILELASVGGHETIGLCPSSHGPPLSVAPYPDAPGYKAVAACLASHSVRPRTEGAIA